MIETERQLREKIEDYAAARMTGRQALVQSAANELEAAIVAAFPRSEDAQG
jgi:hypothetical protein